MADGEQRVKDEEEGLEYGGKAFEGAEEPEADNGEASEEFLTPPRNFAMVERGIYRDPYPEPSAEFVRLRGIRLFRLSIDGRKGTPSGNTEDAIADALKILIDSKNHPVLIQSKPGKRTGCIIVGCFRKLQSWSMVAVLDEFQRFAAKTRISELRFIEALDVSRMIESFSS